MERSRIYRSKTFTFDLHQCYVNIYDSLSLSLSLSLLSLSLSLYLSIYLSTCISPSNYLFLFRRARFSLLSPSRQRSLTPIFSVSLSLTLLNLSPSFSCLRQAANQDLEAAVVAPSRPDDVYSSLIPKL